MLELGRAASHNGWRSSRVDYVNQLRKSEGCLPFPLSRGPHYIALPCISSFSLPERTFIVQHKKIGILVLFFFFEA